MKGQLLALCLVSVVPVLAVPAPGQLFNLTNWKLQLPQASKKGGVVEISQPALATYSSPNFYTNATDMSMTFWCPINGAHTSGSGFPRSELRELFNFTTQGTHVLAVTMRVDEIPPSGSITIGQAHLDGLSGACSIFCELEWTNGEIVSHVRTQTCSSVNMKLPVSLLASCQWLCDLRILPKRTLFYCNRHIYQCCRGPSHWERPSHTS
jgi:hypothetical protein